MNRNFKRVLAGIAALTLCVGVVPHSMPSVIMAGAVSNDDWDSTISGSSDSGQGKGVVIIPGEGSEGGEVVVNPGEGSEGGEVVVNPGEGSEGGEVVVNPGEGSEGGEVVVNPGEGSEGEINPVYEFKDYVHGIGFTLDGKIGVNLQTTENPESFIVKCGDKNIPVIASKNGVSFYIAPKEMVKKYTIEVNGTSKTINPKSILNVYNGKYSEKLANALITYCEAADAYFDGDDSTSVASVDVTAGNYNDIIPDDGNTYKTSLVLESETALKVYISNKNGLTATSGQTQVDKNTVSIKFENIAANNLGQTFDVNDGSFSALSYITKAVNQTDDENLVNLCKALYNYYEAAKEYADVKIVDVVYHYFKFSDRDANGQTTYTETTETAQVEFLIGELPVVEERAYEGNTLDGYDTETPVTEETETIDVWYQPMIYDIDFATIGGTQRKSVNYNSIINSDDITTDIQGYKFLGWTWDGQETPSQLGEFVADKDMTFTAVFEKNKYTVHFDANGGEGTMDDIITECYSRTRLPKSTFSREGYVFAGWSLTPPSADEGGSGSDDEEERIVIGDSGSNEGEGAVVIGDGSSDYEGTISSGGSGEYRVEYVDAAYIENLAYEDGAEVTLYAVWEEIQDGVIIYRVEHWFPDETIVEEYLGNVGFLTSAVPMEREGLICTEGENGYKQPINPDGTTAIVYHYVEKKSCDVVFRFETYGGDPSFGYLSNTIINEYDEGDTVKAPKSSLIEENIIGWLDINTGIEYDLDLDTADGEKLVINEGTERIELVMIKG